MTRLFMHVEGSTEERFVKEILANHLYQHGYLHVSARTIGLAQERERRGGIRGWPEAKKGIVNHLRGDQEVISTTMVDYYGLPERPPGAWPGRAGARKKPLPDRAAHVEDAIRRDLQGELGDKFQARRFIPYVMLHEFEAMLFSDCTLFARGIGRPELEPGFQDIVNAAGEPEAINDTPDGAPSKRIETLAPGYSKPFLGPTAAKAIGLDKIRAACPHFNAWLTRLEEIPKTG